MPSVALVTVASPGIYTDFAREMLESARTHFMPETDVNDWLGVIIEGDEGWPDGTMYRYHHLLAHFPNRDYVFLIDADMRFEGPVGSEILSDGITATQHPGYVGQPTALLPFETRPDSHCFVPADQRKLYYCGGFVGGANDSMRYLAEQVALRIDKDIEHDCVPVWHDESALNCVLSKGFWPIHTLSPAFCHPDNDAYYKAHVWAHDYERKIVALDKSTNQRGTR